MATLIQNELRVKACEDINNMLNEVQTCFGSKAGCNA